MNFGLKNVVKLKLVKDRELPEVLGYNMMNF